MFSLSNNSKARLIGVNPSLVAVVNRAIQLTRVDFGVTEGLRTLDRQKELLAAGATTTLKSKHLTGNAVDLVAYINGKVSWNVAVYDDIADAMKQAAIDLKVSIRWGGAWNVPDITKWTKTMQDAMNYYIDYKRSIKERPFIDAPHFEIANAL